MNTYPYLLRNTARRPVEVHRTDGTVEVLTHGMEIRVESPDPAFDYFERLGVLTRHDAPTLSKPKAERDYGKSAKRAQMVAKAKTATSKASNPKAPSQSGRTTRPGPDEPGGSL